MPHHSPASRFPDRTLAFPKDADAMPVDASIDLIMPPTASAWRLTSAGAANVPASQNPAGHDLRYRVGSSRSTIHGPRFRQGGTAASPDPWDYIGRMVDAGFRVHQDQNQRPAVDRRRAFSLRPPPAGYHLSGRSLQRPMYATLWTVFHRDDELGQQQYTDVAYRSSSVNLHNCCRVRLRSLFHNRSGRSPHGGDPLVRYRFRACPASGRAPMPLGHRRRGRRSSSILSRECRWKSALKPARPDTGRLPLIHRHHHRSANVVDGEAVSCSPEGLAADARHGVANPDPRQCAAILKAIG